MTYNVGVVTKNGNKYKFYGVASELSKVDYVNNMAWYILKDESGEYMAKFSLYDLEVVYYPGRCKKEASVTP